MRRLVESEVVDMVIGEKLRWFGFWALDVWNGGHVRKYYEAVKKSYQRGASVQETQAKIQALIEHATRTTEFYREFAPDTPLAKLPVVNKDTFREHYQEMISAEYKDAGDNRTMSTSGSTGTPLTMIQNKDKINHNTAAGIFIGVAGGYYIGMRQAFIRVWVNNVRKSKFQLFRENMIMMDSSAMDDPALAKMLAVIKKKKVKCLIGYSSALGEISRYIAEHNVDMSDFCVSAIIPISESMPAATRQKLKEQFNCPVRAWYSNEENGIMALQNEDDEGYRIDTETYFYEILKMDSDEPAAPGELGRIVITDLYNYAFPILRYDNGDTAIAKREEKNGRYRMTLTELYGRRSDLIYDCAGRAVTPYIITNNMWDVPGVKQYRFIQEDAGIYTLWLNGDREAMNVEDIVGRIKPYLGEEAKITIDFVDEIPVLASGKRKYIENKWKQ